MKSKKLLIQWICFILGVILLSLLARSMHSKQEVGPDEVYLRFAVTSSTDVSKEDLSQLDRFVTGVYDYAKTQEYTGVDALIVNGYLTANGTSEEYQAVDDYMKDHLLQETRFLSTVGFVNYDTNENSWKDSNIYRNGLTYGLVIKGHLFLCLSCKDNLYDQAAEWLQGATSTYGDVIATNQEIFSFQYFSLADTYYDSSLWSTGANGSLENHLASYPHMMNFSSSVPEPVNHVASIATKEDITYVNTGSMGSVVMSGADYGADLSSDAISPFFTNTAQCRIVEVYGDGRIALKCLNLDTMDCTTQYEDVNQKIMVEENNSTVWWGEHTEISCDLLSEGGLAVTISGMEEKEILYYRMELLYDGEEMYQLNRYGDLLGNYGDCITFAWKESTLSKKEYEDLNQVLLKYNETASFGKPWTLRVTGVDWQGQEGEPYLTNFVIN
ncbi:MAG: hypothetical protein K6C69_04440 [Lachnospiraceae bacterium]|nr:hypothetical protein [Lachnospiraceae bacterium]